MKSENVVLEKSFQFATRVVKLYKHLMTNAHNRVLATQVLKSDTSIGANVHEAVRSQSRNEFIAKMNIALKESYETEYWLRLLHETDYIQTNEFESIFSDCRDLTNIVAKIIITTKENTPNEKTK